MFAKLKKKIEETDGPANRSLNSPGPGIASPLRRDAPSGKDFSCVPFKKLNKTVNIYRKSTNKFRNGASTAII